MEKSVERAALASLKSTSAPAAPCLPDERQKMLALNFRVPLERPVALDATVSDSEWEHCQRIIHFYVDFRLKKVCLVLLRLFTGGVVQKWLCFRVQPFQAVSHLLDSKRTLPIAAQEGAIVRAVQENQVWTLDYALGFLRTFSVLLSALSCVGCPDIW
jgi:hypothetical protein